VAGGRGPVKDLPGMVQARDMSENGMRKTHATNCVGVRARIRMCASISVNV
jgi:hypothetical protein